MAGYITMTTKELINKLKKADPGMKLDVKLSIDQSLTGDKYYDTILSDKLKVQGVMEYSFKTDLLHSNKKISRKEKENTEKVTCLVIEVKC